MQRAATAYMQTKVTTTTQGDIVVMLYDGAVNFLNQSKEYLAAGDMAQKGIAISRAMDVINELDSALNSEKGGTLASNLHGLYIFCTNHLLLANLKKSSSMIDEVIRILSGLRSAYAEILNNPEAVAAAEQAAAHIQHGKGGAAPRGQGVMPSGPAAPAQPAPAAGARMRAMYAKTAAQAAQPAPAAAQAAQQTPVTTQAAQTVEEAVREPVTFAAQAANATAALAAQAADATAAQAAQQKAAAKRAAEEASREAAAHAAATVNAAPAAPAFDDTPEQLLAGFQPAGGFSRPGAAAAYRKFGGI